MADPAHSRSEPVPLRPAATIMVVRDGVPKDGAVLEVLMVRRNLRSDFAGGAYVFPGGGLDPLDAGPGASAGCTGRSDQEASTVLGLATGGLAYWVAALRECFEEAGILVAYDQSGQVLSLSDPSSAARLGQARAALNAGERSFLDVCAAEHVTLAVDRVHYFAHWITPAGAPRRYDTRFFVTAAPAGQTPAHDAGEVIDEEWVSPAEALRRHRAGQIELIFPTIRNLQAIGRFDTTAQLLDAASSAGDVAAIEPRVVADGNGVRIVLPGDPGYEMATPARAPEGQDAFNDAVRSISRAANPDPDEVPGAR